ncbi:Hypothetical_protein [Hexamita inflata]|uniref:Hypothetical_protein n=1 Tax=Hexamita inflata TaxID=28002 RepID=A0AA86PZ63_9EUKA|nr:Hypothetical protein HINF_LOCUS35683 [Hexamita inflata]
MNSRNLISWIPKEFATFDSNQKIMQSTELTHIPSKRYISVNNKNVSKLVTRLQTAIQSTMQSRVHSRPISRQEYVEEIQNLPFWFYNNTTSRNNHNPCQIILFVPSFPIQNLLQLESQNMEMIMQSLIIQSKMID